MKIIITGAYTIGSHLARLLSIDHEDITLIDDSRERLEDAGADLDIMTIQASTQDIQTLQEAGIKNADLYISVTPQQSVNLNNCMMAKALGAKKTVAKIDDPQLQKPEIQAIYKRLGADSLIYPEILAARDISTGLKMSWVRQRWDVQQGALVMLGIKLRDNCEILNKPLKELCGPTDPYYIVAIKRNRKTIVPSGNDTLKPQDMAYFMTTKQYIPYVRKIVGKEQYEDVKNVMIMGGGQTGLRAIENIPEYMNVKLLETNEDRCEELNEVIDRDNVLIIHGDGRDMRLLTEENIQNTQAFVALTGNAETNILACLTAKRLGVRKTVALVENMDYAMMAESLDIGTIINKKAIAASHIYQLMLDHDVSNVRFLMAANAHVGQFTAHPDSKVTSKRVCDLGLPKGAAIGGLVRDGKGMLVSGGTQIEAGDSVVVFCHDVDMKKVEKYFK